MSAFTIGPAEAKRVVRLLETMTAWEAYHECCVTLQSIEPYTDRRTIKVREACARIAQLEKTNPERALAWRAKMAEIAAQETKS